jgi:hypothetical protein
VCFNPDLESLIEQQNKANDGKCFFQFRMD